MTRTIHCLKCGELKPLDPLDVVAGFKRRRTPIKSNQSLACDMCNTPLPEGTDAIATTMWREREGEPERWEDRYSKQAHELPPASGREKNTREYMQAISTALNEVLPQGWGFTLFTFPMDREPGSMNYISNAKREDIRLMLLEFLYRDLGGTAGVLKKE
jgi:hypothetical protein